MVKRDLYSYIVLSLVALLGVIALRIWVYEPVRVNEQMANQYIDKGTSKNFSKNL